MKNRIAALKLEIALAIFFVLVLLGLAASPAQSANLLPDNAYPETLVITAIRGNVITFEQFGTYCSKSDFKIRYRYVTDPEDYSVGDVCAAIMLDIGQEGLVTDDLIIDLQYAGYVR